MSSQFGNVVVVEGAEIGVIVKSWMLNDGMSHDVYVRGYNGVREYLDSDIKHYIYSKQLSPSEYEFYD